MTRRTSPRLALTLALACFAALALACDPIVMIPGGELGGELKPTPESWAFTNDVDTVQLETNPADPYSVNIWCVATDLGLYVAGSKTSQWTENVRADGRVRLRVDGDLYELMGIEASSDADVDAFVAAAGTKYGFEMEPDQRESSILFRLEPR